MSQPQVAGQALPVIDFLKFSETGEPFLEGHRCQACSAMFLGSRAVCSKCGARGKIAPVRLAEKGTLYAYSIVHRSFPGVAVPYVSAIVDLEGGGTLKGNLVDIEPDPARIAFGMPVKVVFRDALGRKDKEGNSYLSYFFAPAV